MIWSISNISYAAYGLSLKFVSKFYMGREPIVYNQSCNGSKQLHCAKRFVLLTISYNAAYDMVHEQLFCNKCMSHIVCRIWYDVADHVIKLECLFEKVLPLINAEFRQICNAGYWALTNAAKIIKRWANHSVNLNTIIRIETFINTMLSHSI